MDKKVKLIDCKLSEDGTKIIGFFKPDKELLQKLNSPVVSDKKMDVGQDFCNYPVFSSVLAVAGEVDRSGTVLTKDALASLAEEIKRHPTELFFVFPPKKE